jgi:hypothetical protein
VIPRIRARVTDDPSSPSADVVCLVLAGALGAAAERYGGPSGGSLGSEGRAHVGHQQPADPGTSGQRPGVLGRVVAPGELGTHLALTTDRMDAADALYCGFADH